MMPDSRYSSENVDASALSQPLKFEFSGKVAPNRILKAATSEFLSSWDADNLEARGIPSKELINVYISWGQGGFGQIVTGNIMVEYDQLEGMGNPIIPLDAKFGGPRFDAFKAWAAAGKAHGSLMIGQLSHPGRQIDKRLQSSPISASDVQLEGRSRPE